MGFFDRRKRIFASAAFAGVLAVAGVAQAADAQLKSETWDDIAKLPDFTGTWLVAAIPSPVASGAAFWVASDDAKKFADAKAKAKSGKIDNGLNECEPNGMPTMMNEKGMQYQFLFTPGRLTIVPEDNQVRRIYTNRDKHIDDPDLTYGGESIGHWEGKIFVIDTIGLLPHLPLVDGFVGEGDQHIVERISFTGANTMQIATTINDSALAKPYSYTLTLTRHRDKPMVEKLCVPKGYNN